MHIFLFLTLYWLFECCKVNAEVVLKATNVDGVFDDDPKRNPNAHLQDCLTYHDVTSKDLNVMDMTAITLCQENNIPSTFATATFSWNIIQILDIPLQNWLL